MGAYHLHIACNVHVAEFLYVAQTLATIVVFVTLDVCLILEHDAVFVAKVVPIRIVGIVAVADVVDVSALHNHHLFLHLVAVDGMSARTTCLVASPAWSSAFRVRVPPPSTRPVPV